MPPTLAAIYVRVSSDAQAERGVSLDAQEAACLRYCEAHGLLAGHVLREEGESAYKLPLAQRTSGAELLTLLATGAATHVVAYQLSRLFRDDLEGLGYIRQWAAAGIGLHFPGGSGEADIDDPFRELMLSIEAAHARAESRITARRVKSALGHIAAGGGWPGTPPFGYRRVGQNGIEPHPEEAPVVRDLFRRVARGESLISLVRHLNAAGTPRRYGAPLWSAFYVSYVLRNPIYKGLVRWSGRDYAGNHEPLVTKRQWQTVQDALLARRNHLAPGGVPRSLSPIMRCGECGGPAVRVVPGDRLAARYGCATRQRVPAADRHPPCQVSACKCEEAIWRQLRIELDPGILEAAAQDATEKLANETSRRRDLERRLGELDEALERTVRLVAQGYPVDVVDRGALGLVEERERVLVALEREATGRGSLEVFKALRGRDVEQVVERLRADDPAQQVEVLRGFFVEVRIWRDRLEFVRTLDRGTVLRPLPAYWGAERPRGEWEW